MNACKLATIYAPLLGRAGLIIWMIPVTFLYHAYRVAGPAQLFNQTDHFLENVAIKGAPLHLLGMGPGPFSLRDDRCGADTTAKA